MSKLIMIDDVAVMESMGNTLDLIAMKSAREFNVLRDDAKSVMEDIENMEEMSADRDQFSSEKTGVMIGYTDRSPIYVADTLVYTNTTDGCTWISVNDPHVDTPIAKECTMISTDLGDGVDDIIDDNCLATVGIYTKTDHESPEMDHNNYDTLTTDVSYAPLGPVISAQTFSAVVFDRSTITSDINHTGEHIETSANDLKDASNLPFLMVDGKVDIVKMENETDGQISGKMNIKAEEQLIEKPDVLVEFRARCTPVLVENTLVIDDRKVEPDYVGVYIQDIKESIEEVGVALDIIVIDDVDDKHLN